ncbi:MAG TPA: hypothetical protein VGA01_12130 [Candidatus Binatia bacterium]
MKKQLENDEPEMLPLLEEGITKEVDTVMFDPNGPIIRVWEEGEIVVYRLSKELCEWAAAVNFELPEDTEAWPCPIEFGRIKGRAYAEFIVNEEEEEE